MAFFTETEEDRGDVVRFTQLSDVPSSYSGQGGKAVYVNTGATGLEFKTGVSTDEKVKYDVNDPTAGYFADKIVAGLNMSVAEGTGANENKSVIATTATPVFTDVGVQGNVSAGIDSYVKLMNHFDTDFSDSELGTPKVITSHGVTISSAVKKFGAGSAYFDGNHHYLSTPITSDFDFGTGDFTIDLQVNVGASGDYQSPFGSRDSGGGGYSLCILPNYTIEWFCGGSPKFVSSVAVTTGVWHHLAIVRASNVITMYLDGNSVGSCSYTGSVNTNPAGTNMIMGKFYENVDSYFLSGYIDELRVSKGIARWIASFTPPSIAYSTTGGTVTNHFTNDNGLINLDTSIRANSFVGNGGSLTGINADYATNAGHATTADSAASASSASTASSAGYADTAGSAGSCYSSSVSGYADYAGYASANGGNSDTVSSLSGHNVSELANDVPYLTASAISGTYAIYNDGITTGQVTSITITGGLITAISVI